MKAIVLAAGMGTRLKPLTALRPKHLLKVGGKAILHRIVDQLEKSDAVDTIFVVVNYKKDQIIQALDEWYPSSSSIEIIYQEETKGTGDAVDTALQQGDITEDFVVVNGDVLFAEALDNFLTAERGSGLIVGSKVEHPTLFGVLDHTDYRLNRIIEKPAKASADAVINAGFYIFPAHAKELFANLGFSERGEREMTDVLDQLVEAKEQITVYPTTEGWFDVGHPWQLLDANQFFMDREQDSYEILAELEPNVQIHGNVHIAKTARIRSGVYIEGPAYIDEHADIGPNCYIRGRTYLGQKSRVGNGCEIKNSIIDDDSHAAHLSYVGDSVIGTSCNLGAGTITANLRHDGRPVKMTIKGKRVSTGRRKVGVIMGDQVKTGIGVDLLPGVKISAKTWLNAGEIVNRDT